MLDTAGLQRTLSRLPSASDGEVSPVIIIAVLLHQFVEGGAFGATFLERELQSGWLRRIRCSTARR